ncbi:MAG TPA: hypothetical protein VFI65_17740 [Streptosporangiaceae bacterium]|nr:hypothetical protein [Streptosporangiaceae bacterium]
MPAFAAPGPVAATVEVAGAQVRITASDRTDTVVLVEPRNPASRKDVKVADKTKVDLADGQLTVKTITPGDKSGSVAITVDLPAGSGLAAYLAYSSVQVDGPVGRCELHMASGGVTATTASGAIRIGRMTHGQANLMNGSGNIEVGIGDGTAAYIDVDSERGRCATASRRRKAPTRPTSRSWSTPAPGTATSPFNEQQADPHEASVTSTS